MLVGFIAVIVIILVIVGIMSSGTTKTYGAVDSAKGTKMGSEISAMIPTIQLYQTSTVNSDYTGLSVAKLFDLGKLKIEDKYTVLGTENFTTGFGAGQVLIKSKSIDGIYYTINESTPTTYSILVIADADKIPNGSAMAKEIESAGKKLTDAQITDTIPGNGEILFEY